MTRLVLPFLLVGLALLAGCPEKTPAASDSPALELVFEFDDRADLEEGAVVMLRGFEVGTVHSVRLASRVRVEIRVDPKHRDSVRSEAYGRIYTQTIGASFLEIVILDPESPPATDRSVLPGATTDAEAAWIEGKHHARELAGKARKTVTEEARKAAEVARKAAGEAAERAGELGGKARDKAWEATKALRDSEAVEKGKRALRDGAGKLRDLID